MADIVFKICRKVNKVDDYRSMVIHLKSIILYCKIAKTSLLLNSFSLTYNVYYVKYKIAKTFE
ncbi:hypothetical protein Q765_09535 [Flavobacterium rivuli WB 3.3-2 = DSM 21788]|uniref:Uncharacterized protein n=1 Tax=Flavobacterium rivuli WB 3.3-2 = DSM 21788 TaxID=1121895 RepID=A0A0A2M3J5_9FLAO|nr:hypothetical protein Q765_09535 [Flavobacterium rivuli WB 3.3-2 = DSM 21788]